MDTILILDDDPANLHGISGLLRSEDYSVLEASSGLQAIERAITYWPLSLFVTDMDLPIASGTEVALKLIGLHPNLPVLFISGTPGMWWSKRDVANFKLFRPSNVDFIEKPFSLSALLIRVRGLIGKTPNITRVFPAASAREAA